MLKLYNCIWNLFIPLRGMAMELNLPTELHQRKITVIIVKKHKACLLT